MRAQGISFPPSSLGCCFAGDDDELVVAASSDHSLQIWSVPSGRGDRIINQSLLSLRGHQKEINSVRYCKFTSALASGGCDSVIKLWTTKSSRYKNGLVDHLDHVLQF